MRIALVDPGDFTPAYDEELARGLRRLGHEVVLIGKHGGPPGGREVRRAAFYALLAQPWSRSLPGAVARVVKGGHHMVDMARLLFLLRRMRPDVIHFQWMPLPMVDAVFIRSLQRIAPLVLTVHDAEPYQGATNRLMALGFARLVRAADAVIVHTRGTAARLRRYVVSPDRVHQVPHGLLHADAVPEADRQPAPDRRLRLLQFGKVKAYKGVDVLIEALGLLAPEIRSRIHVRIVGAPYVDTQPLIRRVRELHLENVVEFRLRFVPEPEMMDCFAEADAMLFPYRQIDASGVLAAALAQGKPVIATRTGAFVELLEDGREALLVEPEDAAGLAAALASLARSPQRLVAMRDAIRQTRDTIPGWDEIGIRTIAVYDRAAAGAASAERTRRRAAVSAP